MMSFGRIDTRKCYKYNYISNSKTLTLIIHGYGSSGNCYPKILNWIRYQKTSVLIPDLFGHGLSDGVRGFADVMEHCRILKQLLEEFDYNKLYVLGISFGGLIAYHLTKYSSIDKTLLLSPAILGSYSNSVVHNIRKRSIRRILPRIIPANISGVIPINPLELSSYRADKTAQEFINNPNILKYVDLRQLAILDRYIHFPLIQTNPKTQYFLIVGDKDVICPVTPSHI